MQARLVLFDRGRWLLAITAALALLAPLTSATPAERPWLKLQTPRFGVVSQLNEQATRHWATEFDQFIDALDELFSVNDVALPPLTIVMFNRVRDFQPYYPQMASGQAKVAAFFGNAGAWSVIGLAQGGDSTQTRRTIYHEAVHWFLSATASQAPTWFEEGIAEVFSTFEVKSGKARWGAAIPEHLDYLSAVGLQPLDEFMRVSQDEALQKDRYYPEAWLLVHYLMFGNGGTDRPKLQKFLRLRQETDLDSAFAQAFGMSYEEMTSELRAYLRKGRYFIGLADVQDHSTDLTTAPASAANVEFALARLAVVGDNDDLGRQHVQKVLEMAPRAPEGYELRAMLDRHAGNSAAQRNDLDRAIELGSNDANTLSSKAFLLIEANQHEGSGIDEQLPHDVARTAADLFDRSIDLRPRFREAYRGLTTALLNVDTVSTQDDAALAAGRRAFPNDGIVLVGQAAAARRRNDIVGATGLLRRSRAEPFDLPDGYGPVVTYLYNRWLVEWLTTRVGDFGDMSHVAEAQAFLAEQLTDASLADQSRTLIDRLQNELHGLQRLDAARAARRQGRIADADAIFTELANDSTLSTSLREFARRAAEANPLAR